MYRAAAWKNMSTGKKKKWIILDFSEDYLLFGEMLDGNKWGYMKEIVCEQNEDSEYRFTRENSTLGIRPCDFGAEKNTSVISYSNEHQIWIADIHLVI